LLVDDVYTTGSTICAATQKLLDAGARHVRVLTIARVGNR
jgi:predicted amidophosphoribosyltransferase